MTYTKPRMILLAVLTMLTISCHKDIPKNLVPVADAGPSKTITLDPKNKDTVTLSGSGTDTDGKIVGYLWSQVSGPAATTIVNPGSPSTSVEGLIQGTYVFQLMVTDNEGATGVDTTTVIVSPAPTQTLTLQPSDNPNEFLYLNHNGVDGSGFGPARIDIPIEAWTSGGTPYTIREAIKFDLSTIPVNATIISAGLYLYSYPNPTTNGNLVDANFGTNNTMLVQQITFF